MLCRISLPLSSKQRIMSSSFEANKEVVELMLMFVGVMLSYRGGNRFRTEYTCSPCFANLEKASRHYINGTLLISKLIAAA